jgi:hypothetical protein
MSFYLFFISLFTSLFIPGQPTLTPTDLSASIQQTNAAASPSATSLGVLEGTAFLARLSADLVLDRCKIGDPVEAEVKQDVKRGKQVLLKKGSILRGNVKSVQAPTENNREVVVEILMDEVNIQKTAQKYSVHLVIQAIAPGANTDSNNSLADQTGTGLHGATRQAGVSGHASVVQGDVGAINAESKGVFDLPGLRLGEHQTSSGHTTLLATSVHDLKLKKGSQLVMRVVN